ncbi:MAG: hypothetical protein V4506_09735 [Bacteroidota bacterium]
MQPKRSITRMMTITFIAIVVLVACKAKKVKAVTEPLPEKAAFYTIEALRDTVKKVTDFKLLKVTVVDTKIKYNADFTKTKNPDFLKIEITGKQSEPIIVYTEHPLFKKFDLYSDSGEIASKLISLQKGQVTFRVPYFEEYKIIKITETINFKVSIIKTINHEN